MWLINVIVITKASMEEVARGMHLNDDGAVRGKGLVWSRIRRLEASTDLERGSECKSNLCGQCSSACGAHANNFEQRA